MFCKNCGRQLPDNAAFCPGCGEKRPDGNAYMDGRSSTDIRNLPSYAKEIDRSGHAVDSDRKKFSLSDPDRRKFSLSDSGRDKFSLSDSGRDKFSLSDKSRKGDDGGIVRLTSSREPAAQKKEPATSQREPATPPMHASDREKGPVAPPREPTGFVNPLKDSGGTVFRFGDSSGTEGSEPAKDTTAASPAKNTPAADQSTFVQPEQTPPPEPDPAIEGNDVASGFVNPLKEAGIDIQLGSDGDRNQPADDSGKINSHLRFAVWMVILSCTCCNPITLILGIIAIVFAFQVSTFSRRGNPGIALQKAAVARILCWITFGLLAVWILSLVATLCLPMPEDKRSTQEDQVEHAAGESVDESTEQAAGESVDESTEQAAGESVDESTEQAAGITVESVKPEQHNIGRRILWDILD